MMKQLLTKTVRKFMIEQLKEQISELNLSREEDKAKLFNLYADKADQKERWLVYGEHTSLEDRVTLEADTEHALPVELQKNTGFCIKKWKTPTYVGGKQTRIYALWSNMHMRASGKNTRQQQHQSYLNCTIAPEWYDYDEFHNWVEEHPFHATKEYGKFYNLDKDLLCKGNKVYSSDMCEFIPFTINVFLTYRKSTKSELPVGVYKNFNKYEASISNPFQKKSEYLGLYQSPEEAFHVYKLRKEEFARMLGEKYRGYVTEPVYETLLNYKIDITD